MPISVQEIVNYLKMTDYSVERKGNCDINIDGFCSLQSPKSNCITWVKEINEHSLDEFGNCDHVLIVAKESIVVPIKTVVFLITPEPKAVFFSILEHFWKKKVSSGIAETAVIKTKKIGEDVAIGHHCFIGEEVMIGSGTIIEENVTIIHRVEIGANCFVHSGAVIGADGFGYFINHEGKPEKVTHYGGVKIGNQVEIGANTCIDRGTIEDTIIEDDVKIDNLCHIAHNVRIKEAAMIAAGSVLCGSAKIGAGSYLAPGSIVKNQLVVGANALVGMGAVVIKEVPENIVVTGVPAKKLRKVKKTDK